MRVLHLIDPHSPDGGPCTLRLLADLMPRLQPADHHVLVLGSRRYWQMAQECGVEPAACMSPPQALPWGGARSLRRYLKSAPHPFDLIHAWTARAAALAGWAAPRLPRLATFHVGRSNNLASALAARMISRYGGQPILAASAAVWREYQEAGISKERLTLMPPAVDRQSSALLPRPAVRQRWAIDRDIAIDSSTFVVGLIGEPANWSDVHAAVMALGRAVAAGRKIKLLISPDAGGTAGRIRAQETVRQLSLDGMLVIDDEAAHPWRVVGGLDASMALGSGVRSRPASSVLPLLWSLAAGVPVIAEECDAFRDVVEDGVTGYLIRPGDINASAERIVRLYDDRSLAARLGENARHVVTDTFGIDAYGVRLRHSYELLLADREIRTLEESHDYLEMSSETPVLV